MPWKKSPGPSYFGTQTVWTCSHASSEAVLQALHGENPLLNCTDQGRAGQTQTGRFPPAYLTLSSCLCSS